jgi:hypothetical protein
MLLPLLLLAASALGCPSGSGWLPMPPSCYLISPTHLNWLDANKFCQEQGGHLVEVDGPQEELMVEMLMSSHTATGAYWLGATDQAAEGAWMWAASGTPLGAGFTNWMEGFPGHPGPDCACVTMEMFPEYGTWSDEDCSHDRHGGSGWAIHAICEAPY